MLATESTQNAMALLLSNRVSGIAVTHPTDGTIVANFSASDVRALATVTNQADVSRMLQTPVYEFLRSHRADTGCLSPVTVISSDSVGMAIELLAEGKLHHVYEVDALRKPVGVLSVTDILHALAALARGA